MKYRFKLVAGHYAEGGNLARDRDGELVNTPDSGEFKLWRKGDIVETDRDLAAICNRPGSIKFQALNNSNDPTLMNMEELLAQKAAINAAIIKANKADIKDDDEYHDSDGLEDFTIAELREMASEEPVADLTGLSKKEEIIAAIRASQLVEVEA